MNAAGAAGFDSPMSIPVYLGDSLQLRFRTGDMFAEREIRIQTHDENNTELVFPVSLVERAESFDALMGDISAYIERDQDPLLALDDNGINDHEERTVYQQNHCGNATTPRPGEKPHLGLLHQEHGPPSRPIPRQGGRGDWQPALDQLQPDSPTSCALGYRISAGTNTASGPGGRYATHQDVGGLFFTRSVDLYLKEGGTIGFVLPHSALQAGQYSKWRKGQWHHRTSGQSVHADFTIKPAWDLEKLEPNTFFPVPASVVFASKCPADTKGQPLGGTVEQWRGQAGTADVRREPTPITDTGIVGDSPYGKLSRNGATIFPRVFFFVNEIINPAIVQAAPTVTVSPRRSSQEKSPWRGLNLTAITGQTVERRHLCDVHLGETIAPYVTLPPLKALLPFKQGESDIPTDKEEPSGIRMGGLEPRMRERWQNDQHIVGQHQGISK